MSVYLAAKTSSAAADHPLFKAKGITGYTATQLTRLFVHGLATTNEVAYGAYRQNIALFLAATHFNRKIPTTEIGCLISDYTRPAIPYTTPAIAFVLRERPSADKVEMMRSKFAAFTPTFDKIGNSTRVTLSTPTLRIAEASLSICQPTVQAQGEAIHPSQLRSFYHVVHVISEFLATNTYSGFRTVQAKEGEEEVEAPGSATLEYSMLEEYGGIGVPQPRGMGKFLKVVDQALKVGATKEKTWGDVTVADLEEALTFNMRSPMFVLGSHLKDHVITAKPSPIPITSNCGPISRVPTGTPGLVFPYIPRMVIPERTNISRHMYTTFARTFGSSIEEIKATLKRMSPGFESLSLMASQGYLVHLLEGISLSLQTQTRMYAIFEDREYLGFVLLGSRFTIFDGDSWVSPVSGIELEVQIAKLSSHAKSMATICEVLTRSTLKPTSEGEMEATEEVLPMQITSSGQLVDELLRRKYATEDMETITEQLDKLRFSNASFRDLSGNELEWFVKSMSATPFAPLSSDVHVYIPTKFLELADPLVRYLAAFGPDVPSPQNLRGDVYKMPTLKQDDEGKNFIPDGEHLESLIFSRKPLLVAANDWRSFLKSKTMRMDMKERARNSRCLVLKGDMLKRVEFGMVMWTHTATGAKRAREKDDDGDEPSAKKSRKAPEVSLDDFLADL